MTPAELAARGPLYAEDLEVGFHVDLGTVSLSRQEIVDFATVYDPLPLHTDGRGSQFGDVIASGAHTFSMFTQRASTHVIPHLALIAGKGVDRLRLPHPVRPGAVLRGAMEVTAVIPRDDRADVHFRSWFVDDAGRTVLDMSSIVVVLARPRVVDDLTTPIPTKEIS